MARLEINVTGTGSATRLAERGTLVLQLQSRSLPTKEEAAAALTTYTNKLIDTIAPYCSHDEATGRTKNDAAISHYFVDVRDTTNQREKQSDSGSSFIMSSTKATYITAHSARADMYIDFADFNALNSLVTQFSAMENVKIQRVTWHLTEATLTAMESSARKAAAKDSLQRARDYAEVFANLEADDAVRKVKAQDIREASKYERSVRPQKHYGRKQSVKTTFKKEKAEMQFELMDIVIEVKVNGKFVVE